MTAFAGVGFPKSSATVDSHGRAHVAVSCPAGSGGCTGKLVLTARAAPHKKLGSASFKIAAGATKRVSVKLNAAARAQIKRNHKLKATAAANAADAAGAHKHSSTGIVLK
jgi:hypothetical protein